MRNQITQPKERMEKTPIIFKPIYPDKGVRGLPKNYSSHRESKPPLKIFYNKVAIGLIICKPIFQIQIKGKKMDIKPKSLGEAKAYVINNFHLYT